MALLEAETRPLYQRVAQKARHLQELGLSASAVARRLGVNDKTVTKAIEWLEAVRS